MGFTQHMGVEKECNRNEEGKKRHEKKTEQTQHKRNVRHSPGRPTYVVKLRFVQLTRTTKVSL